MDFITLDLGVSTGFSHFRDNNLIFTETLVYTGTSEYGDRLAELLDKIKPSMACVELPAFSAPGDLQLKLMTVDAISRALLTRYIQPMANIHYINAGLWKPARDNIKVPEMPYGKLTEHEKDAYKIGIWVIKFRKDWLDL